jgi:hypothetical protein
MRLMPAFLLLLVLLALAGCSSAQRSGGAPPTSTERSSTAPPAAAPQAGAKTAQDGQLKNVSLNDAEASQQSSAAAERKIIRDAELFIESDAPMEAQRKVTAIAEANGGFVVTSESKQNNVEGQLKPDTIVKVVARVPAAKFGAVLDQMRTVGSRVVQEKVTGQDVTQEYIDLEAHIRTKKALEAQFLEIMKQARTVSEALEVQRQIEAVRGEIEQLEGRRRFLENQSSLSTVTVTLQPPGQLVSSSGFLASIKRAFSDGVDIAATITLFLIRVILALIPVALLIFLPLGLLLRYLIRRARRYQLARRLETAPETK